MAPVKPPSLAFPARLQEKALMLGKIEGRRKRGHQSMRWLGSIINSMGMNLSKLSVIVEIKEAWHAACPWGCTDTGAFPVGPWALSSLQLPVPTLPLRELHPIPFPLYSPWKLTSSPDLHALVFLRPALRTASLCSAHAQYH